MTVFYERFRKVGLQCNTVVHATECNRSMRLRKVCPQCNTVVHLKRSVCDCGHALTTYKCVKEEVQAFKLLPELFCTVRMIPDVCVYPVVDGNKISQPALLVEVHSTCSGW